MNRIYLTGIVYDQPMALGSADAGNHIVFKLVVRHRAKTGVKSEIYRINAWNECAKYCMERLQKGTRVALDGYLTQRTVLFGEKQFQAVEVTVSEIMMANRPAEALPVEMKPTQIIGESAI